MIDKLYLLGKLEYNGMTLVSCGFSNEQVHNQIIDSLKLLFVSSDMFNKEQVTDGPSYFINLAHNVLQKATLENKFEIFNLTGLGLIFDGKQKISNTVTTEASSDLIKYWAFMWHIAKNNTTGLLGQVPSIDELRWLVTDEGFYITKLNPSSIVAKTLLEKENLIFDLISHFDTAHKLGAPNNVLLILSEIIDLLIVKFNEGSGNFYHLSIEQLQEKYNQLLSIEQYNEAQNLKFKIAGPTSSDIEEIIALRLSNHEHKYPISNFKITDVLKQYLKNSIQRT